tara:strand:+ start:490 stop:654 length:165 start_codon:yes stop_codon:yes gene_type:complete
MKILKAIIFTACLIYVLINLDDAIKGEGLYMSFVLIIVGIAYICGMIWLFYGRK